MPNFFVLCKIKKLGFITLIDSILFSLAENEHRFQHQRAFPVVKCNFLGHFSQNFRHFDPKISKYFLPFCFQADSIASIFKVMEMIHFLFLITIFGLFYSIGTTGNKGHTCGRFWSPHSKICYNLLHKSVISQGYDLRRNPNVSLFSYSFE